MGQKDLADAARAKETPKETPKKTTEVAPAVEKESFESGFTPTEDLNPKAKVKPKSVVRAAAPKVNEPETKEETKTKEEAGSYAELKKSIPTAPKNYKPPIVSETYSYRMPGTNGTFEERKNVSPEIDSEAYRKKTFRDRNIDIIRNRDTKRANEKLDAANKKRKEEAEGKAKGGKIKKMAKGGTVKRSSASKRADGCAIRGKTRA